MGVEGAPEQRLEPRRHRVVRRFACQRLCRRLARRPGSHFCHRCCCDPCCRREGADRRGQVARAQDGARVERLHGLSRDREAPRALPLVLERRRQLAEALSSLLVPCGGSQAPLQPPRRDGQADGLAILPSGRRRLGGRAVDLLINKRLCTRLVVHGLRRPAPQHVAKAGGSRRRTARARCGASTRARRLLHRRVVGTLHQEGRVWSAAEEGGDGLGRALVDSDLERDGAPEGEDEGGATFVSRWGAAGARTHARRAVGSICIGGGIRVCIVGGAPCHHRGRARR